MNFIHIAGNLGADPEVRYTSTGKKVTNLRVATKDRKAKNNDVTIWYRVTVWGEEFDKMISFLKKGSSVIVHGHLHKPEMFNDKEGKPTIGSLEITATSIEFSPFGKPASATGAQTSAPQTSESPNKDIPVNPYMSSKPTENMPFDDEVPF